MAHHSTDDPQAKEGSQTDLSSAYYQRHPLLGAHRLSVAKFAHDFPKWKTVYNVFWHWRNDGIWQKIHDALCRWVRKNKSKKPTPSVGIIDSQSAKTTENGGDRGYDAGKKVNGRKRHIVVDTLGLIMSLVIHTADIQDQEGAKLTIEKLDGRFKRLKKIFGDSAYKRSGLPDWVAEKFGWELEVISRPVGTEGFCGLTEALDCRANVCVDRQTSATREGLRTKHRFKQNADLHCHDRKNAKDARKTREKQLKTSSKTTATLADGLGTFF